MSDTERNLLQQIGPTVRAMYGAFEDAVGHPMPRWRVLHALHTLGDATQKQLVQRLLIDPGLLTRHMKTMEAEGLIARHTDSDDNRLTHVQLTAAGKALIDEASPKRQAFFDAALAEFDEADLAKATQILQALEARFRQQKG
ncbi:MarR family winged helix-turn-helix transcriptional regulator [Amantichitinum ursilacus]|uniref:Transcriptional regulator SlyA n=1 Tax=Amantichitinum ursilacus TaxID=857265 RepID=A0A0N0GNU2_9NEIS|nr:MarR family transcriptional regulator [Amantichitinum ursilacus]KPC53075.1 transcriptional regulator SlyA [Amantichitinum ursilacus]